jgi:dihydrolipoamide dehydrogenase
VGVETVGLEPGKPIEVDDWMRAPGLEWLYAIGDVNGRALLTHMGKYQARIAADKILGPGGPCLILDGARAPRVTFTDPQVAAVGYTLAAAQDAGLNARAVEVSTQGSAGASFYGRDDAIGTTRLVVDDDAGVLAGATFTGPEVAEFLQAATIAVVAKVPLEMLAHAIPAFPTRSELWLYLMEALGLSGPCQREA